MNLKFFRRPTLLKFRELRYTSDLRAESPFNPREYQYTFRYSFRTIQRESNSKQQPWVDLCVCFSKTPGGFNDRINHFVVRLTHKQICVPLLPGGRLICFCPDSKNFLLASQTDWMCVRETTLFSLLPKSIKRDKKKTLNIDDK